MAGPHPAHMYQEHACAMGAYGEWVLLAWAITSRGLVKIVVDSAAALVFEPSETAQVL